MELYDSIGWLYEVLYADHKIDWHEKAFIKEHDSILKNYTGCKIHVAACGNGIQAIALKQAGYDVTASDVSKEMVLLASQNAAKHGLSLEVFVSDWKKICTSRSEQYRLLLCTGNSLCHATNREDRQSVLHKFYEMLEDGGTLIIDSRNWEKLNREKEEYSVLKMREYKGRQYIPIYLWQHIELEQPSLLKILFVELGKDSQKVYERRIDFIPFTSKSLYENCKDVGFKIIKDTFNVKTDFYYMYLQK